MSTIAIPTGQDVTVTGVPAAVAEAIRRVYDQCGGTDFAHHILTAAKDGDTALRGYFEWDDNTAAHEYRLAQAQDLVRRVKVTVLRQDSTDPIAVRAYIARRDLPAAAGEDAGTVVGGYLAIEEVAAATEQQAALMESIRRDLIRVQSKYSHVKEYFNEVAEEVLKAG